MRYGRMEVCGICGGSGKRDPGLEGPCTYCRGSGQVLLVWMGLRCTPLWRLAEDPGTGLLAQFGLQDRRAHFGGGLW